MTDSYQMYKVWRKWCSDQGKVWSHETYYTKW